MEIKINYKEKFDSFEELEMFFTLYSKLKYEKHIAEHSDCYFKLDNIDGEICRLISTKSCLKDMDMVRVSETVWDLLKDRDYTNSPIKRKERKEILNKILDIAGIVIV